MRLDLTGTFERTKVFGLYWKTFSNEELITLGLLFDLKVSRAENIHEEDNLVAEINADAFKSHAEIAFKRSSNRKTYYVVVYYLSRPDKTFEGKLFVHGIWELLLSEKLPKRLKLGIEDDHLY